MTDTVIRVDTKKLVELRAACASHPLKPTIKAATERGISLVIKEIEDGTRNAK
jgi:hypothetical protein